MVARWKREAALVAVCVCLSAGLGCGKPSDSDILARARQDMAEHWRAMCSGSPGEITDVSISSRRTISRATPCGGKEGEFLNVIARGRCPSGASLCTEVTYILCKKMVGWSDIRMESTNFCSPW